MNSMRVPLIGVPPLPSDLEYSKWYRACHLQEPLLAEPCRPVKYVFPNKTVAKTRLEPDSTESPGDKVPGKSPNPDMLLGESAGTELGAPTRVKSGHVLHKRVFVSNAPLTLRNPSKTDTEQGELCWKQGSMCAERTRQMGYQLNQEQESAIVQKGMKWVPGAPKVFFTNERAPDVPEQQCRAAFHVGLAVCNRGRQVSINCDPGLGKGRVTFSVGCECDGIVMEGLVNGRMAAGMATLCSGQMQNWAKQMETSYMQPTNAEKCAAVAVTACAAQAQVYVAEEEQYRGMSNISAGSKVNQMKTALDIIKKKDAIEVEAADMLRAKLAGNMFKYLKIPGFGMPIVPGQYRKADSIVDCQTDCDSRNACKSFSYNDDTGDCSWAKHKIDYDDNYVLYLKRGANNDDNDHFTAMPGIKLGVDVEYQGEKSINECKFDCLTSVTCSAFSYAARSHHCVQSQVKLQIGADRNYYEKTTVLGQKQMDMNNDIATEASKERRSVVVNAVKNFKAESRRLSIEEKQRSDDKQAKEKEEKVSERAAKVFH